MRLYPIPCPRRAAVVAVASMVACCAVPSRSFASTARPSTSARPAVTAADTLHHAEVALARAVVLWRNGEARAAADLLAELDLSPSAAWPDADRAAFLLAVLERRLGRPQALREKVAAAIDPASASPYRRWLAHLALWDAAAGGDVTDPQRRDIDSPSLPGEAVLTAALLMETGRAAEAADLLARVEPDGAFAAPHLHLLAVACEQSGRDPRPAWRRLADLADAQGPAARLVATAQLRLAEAALVRGEPADDLLRRVAEGDPADTGPLAARARQALALTALARGDTAAALGHLDAALAGPLDGPSRRRALLERGALRGARADLQGAEADFAAADADWAREVGALAAWGGRARDAAVDSAWAAWTGDDAWELELRPDAGALLAALDALADAALDLRGRPDADPARRLAASDRDASVALPSPAGEGVSAGIAATHQPTPAELDAWRRLRDELARAESRRAASAWDADKLRRERDRRLDYLERGRRHAAAEADTLAAAGLRLERLRPRLAAALESLRGLQDEAVASIAARTRALGEDLRRNALYAQAVAHFHVAGPVDARRGAAATTAAADLLAQEIALSAQLERFGAAHAAKAPDLIARSLAEVWEPRLRDGYAGLLAARARQDSLAAAITADLAALTARARDDAAIAQADLALAAAGAQASALADSLRTTRAAIAAQVAARARATLELEREGIDYHLADAAYWSAVHAALDPATEGQPGTFASLRGLAMARLDTFLSRHPRSAGLSEARFRLADLELFRAREAFEARIAGYLDGDAGAVTRALAPLFDGGGAESLYEAILRDDPAFAHRDAVLFNLGMLRVDSGRADGLDLLAELVRDHPGAAGAQQAWLRLGDARFEARDYAGCLDPYEHAAAGSDPAHAAIALYRLGWARFATDAFAESGLAFGRLLDLESGAQANLRDEAHDHLVQALLRAGGAAAFERHVERVGVRPWDRRTLAAMATQAARYSLDDEAIACDRLWLARYADEAGALDAAERLANGLERAGSSEEAVRSRLAQAPRFLPGSPWLAANDTTGLHERADRFARRAYEGAAAFEHRTARAGRDSTAWARALGHYESFLAHWPAAAEAPRLEYQAGEAARELGAHAQALAHFEAAARSDTAAFAVDAAWQAIAVRDAWYRSTLGPGRAAGDDSLATALLRAGDAFLARHPGHAQAADLAWRQGQVAYAHGRDEEASRRLLGFSERHPDDANAPAAARLAGDAHYRRRDYVAAGSAYERAATLADRAGRRDLAGELAALVPRCAWEHAAAVAAADSAAGAAAAAPLFQDLAARWPGHEQAPAALYRAGLGFAAAGDDQRAIAAWERIVDGAGGAFARDASVRIAQAHESAGRAAAAARAWAGHSARHPDDEDAPAALLRAIDLSEAAVDTAGAEALRDDYLRRFPDDIATAFVIAHARARRELAQAAREGRPVTALAAEPGAGRKKAAAPPATAVRRYLDLAADHPAQADAALLARIDFLCAEEAFAAYRGIRLTQPLPTSLATKNGALEKVVALYNRCVERGEPEPAHAAAHRIGEAVIHLGQALLDSERPAGLAGDDLAAYDEVLREQAWSFTVRGEDAWAQLLREARRGAGADPGGWLARTERELWPRLAQRYVHRPELEYPLAPVAARAGH